MTTSPKLTIVNMDDIAKYDAKHNTKYTRIIDNEINDIDSHYAPLFIADIDKVGLRLALSYLDMYAMRHGMEKRESYLNSFHQLSEILRMVGNT